MPTIRRQSDQQAQSQELVQRFVMLDTSSTDSASTLAHSTQSAAAADSLSPLRDERHGSPPQSRPKPKPVTGITRQLENVADAKPSLKTRNVGDVGDAHRLIARFVGVNEERPRSMMSRPLENIPEAKPSFKIRNVGDVGEAHRVIARFVGVNDEKSCSTTTKDLATSRQPENVAEAKPSLKTRNVGDLEDPHRLIAGFVGFGRGKSHSTAAKDPATSRQLENMREAKRKSTLRPGEAGGSSQTSTPIHEEKENKSLDVPRGHMSMLAGPSKREQTFVGDRAPNEQHFRQERGGVSPDPGADVKGVSSGGANLDTSSDRTSSSPLGAQTDFGQGPLDDPQHERAPSFSASVASFNRDNNDKMSMAGVESSTLCEYDIFHVLNTLESEDWRHGDDFDRKELMLEGKELVPAPQVQQNTPHPRRSVTTGPALNPLAPSNDVPVQEQNTPLDNVKNGTSPTFAHNAHEEVPLRQISSEDMFQRLVGHGCVDMSSHMDPTRHSSVFIAGGVFGDIWKGKLRDGTEVAIKVWRFSSIPQDGPKPIKRAVQEIYYWSKTKHKNMQELVGVLMFQGRLGMVSPWMYHGNLREYIFKYPNVDRYSLCVQAVAGVSYLHSCKMVHGDLQAANILVSKDGVAKLSNFDHSIMAECSLVFLETRELGGGTTRWMAPELILDESSRRNESTDIYALGMTMFEIITGTSPYYPECREEIHVMKAVIQGRLPKRQTTHFGDNTRDNQMWELLLHCWSREPTARPDATGVYELLSALTGG